MNEVYRVEEAQGLKEEAGDPGQSLNEPEMGRLILVRVYLRSQVSIWWVAAYSMQCARCCYPGCEEDKQHLSGNFLGTLPVISTHGGTWLHAALV